MHKISIGRCSAREGKVLKGSLSRGVQPKPSKSFWPCLGQTLLILLPCLIRQETLLISWSWFVSFCKQNTCNSVFFKLISQKYIFSKKIAHATNVDGSSDCSLHTLWKAPGPKPHPEIVKRYYIQLFRERLSEKVHVTILKGIVGGFKFTIL